MEIKSFLESLYGDAEGYISLWEKSTKKTCFIDVSKIDTIVDTAMSISNDIYFGVGLGCSPKDIGRFKAEDIKILPALFLDIDVAGDAHKSTNLPANFNIALEFLRELPIEPSIVVSSGSGLHVYYVFKEPWELDSAEEQLKAQQILKGWESYVRSRCKWTIDSVAELARVLRLPNTFNCKNSKKPIEVTVLFHNGNKYNPSDFEQFSIDITKTEKRDKFKRLTSDGPASMVIERCNFIKACKDYAPELSESQWTAMITNIARCSDGPEACHELSRPYAGYSEQETNDKIYHCLNDMHPQTCQYIRDTLQFNQCPSGGCGVKAPVGFALAKAKKTPKTTDENIDKPVPDGFFDTETALISITKLTDLGNAEYFEQYYKGKIKYCYQMDKWLIWDGKKWVIDSADKITVKAGECVRSMYDFLSKISDDDVRKKLFNHAMKSEDARKLSAMIRLAKGRMTVSVDELDQDQWLINSPTGIIDLRTGALLPHDPEKNMTKMITANYDSFAECPVFEKFIHDIFNGNENLVKFMQRFLGYCLTGDTREQQFVIAHGDGRNGKGTLLNLISEILADYGKTTPTEVLYSKKFDKASNDVARLAGARFVVASEGEKGKKFDEPLIKKMTGQDMLAARYLYKETFEFMPQFKLILMTNDKPVASEDDAALWERIQLVPFNQKFLGEKANKNLKYQLREPNELSGILQWLIAGCLEWQRIGLQPPQEVILATQEYRSENDKLQDWIDDCCVVNEKLISSPKDLYRNFQTWCLSNGEKFIMIHKHFVKSLAKHGFHQFAGTGNYQKTRGIALMARDVGRESPY